MKKHPILVTWTLLCLIVTLSVNYFLPVSRNVSDVANALNNEIEPAGYAFAIWGLIYVLMAIWIIRAYFVRGYQQELYGKVLGWTSINLLFNGLWVISYGSGQIIVSLAIIVVILLTLIMIYRIISVNNEEVKPFMRLPISLYMGWVSVATIINVFNVFTDRGIESFLFLDEIAWTIIMLVIGWLLAFTLMKRFDDIIYPLPFIWAYVAIYVESTNMYVQYVSLGLAIVVGLFVLYQVILRLKNR
ncbi:TspO/MBR family protein [Alkalihalobacillus pseudalcaliphilus]|uniref:TspO/MBR family protein n=1 Tax=Alkalihalobacillus pseudalcaliphilus TaxID=79884 RepID=UPI00064DEEE9|nr:TspO/MBR family protein [Alkalihalobacillus pseudalcaliphilus]KMK76128.1 hypothetical protein AB990_12950 [Alkalihalobacillus pseudalcaliphilus]